MCVCICMWPTWWHRRVEIGHCFWWRWWSCSHPASVSWGPCWQRRRREDDNRGFQWGKCHLVHMHNSVCVCLLILRLDTVILGWTPSFNLTLTLGVIRGFKANTCYHACCVRQKERRYVLLAQKFSGHFKRDTRHFLNDLVFGCIQQQPSLAECVTLERCNFLPDRYLMLFCYFLHHSSTWYLAFTIYTVLVTGINNDP